MSLWKRGQRPSGEYYALLGLRRFGKLVPVAGGGPGGGRALARGGSNPSSSACVYIPSQSCPVATIHLLADKVASRKLDTEGDVDVKVTLTTPLGGRISQGCSDNQSLKKTPSPRVAPGGGGPNQIVEVPGVNRSLGA